MAEATLVHEHTTTWFAVVVCSSTTVVSVSIGLYNLRMRTAALP